MSGVAAPPCNLWEFDIPLAMRNAQRLDQVRFRMGLPNLFALGGRGLAHDDPPAN